MKASRIAPIIFVWAVASVLSCAGSRQKSVVGKTPEPRPENTNLIFASDSARAESGALATDRAKQLAVAELGRKTGNLVGGVARQLAEDTGLAQDSTLFAKFTELCEAASDSIILMLSRIEEQTIEPEPDGFYRAKVSASLPVGAVKLVIIELIKIKQSIYAPLQGSETFKQIARATEESSSISKPDEEKLRAWLQQYGARQSLALEKLSENLADSTELANVEPPEKSDDEDGGITSQIRSDHDLKTPPGNSQADSTRQKNSMRTTRGEEWNPATSASDSEAHSQYGALDEIIGQLPQANFAFRAPDTMMANESRDVVLLMSAGMASVAIKDTIIFAFDEQDGKGKISADSIKYTPIMEAELRGEGLDITPVTPGKQLVGRQNYTRWVWSVKARGPGAKTLDVALNLVIERGGREPMKHTIKTFKRKIFVRELETNVFKTWFNENLTSILIGALLAFFSAFFTHFFTRLSQKKNRTKRIKAAKKNQVASSSLKTIISRWIKVNFFVRLFHHRTNF
jgi:hypothetical protein